MSTAADRLARTRLAIIGQMGGRTQQQAREPRPAASGAFASLKAAAGRWWRGHPAHVGVDLLTPALARYAGNKPLQFLGIAAAIGAAAAIARPWRLISITGAVLAIAKSSQWSSVLLSALSGADTGKGGDPPQ